MKHHFFLALAIGASVVMGAASCKSDDSEDVAQPGKSEISSDISGSRKKHITFTAGDGDFGKSLGKAKYDASAAGKIIWQSADQFSVFPAGKGENAQGSIKEIDGDDASVCKIDVEVENPSSDGYFALYPYSAPAACDGGIFTGVAIPASQKVSAGQFDPKADVMAAYADGIDKSLSFKHIGTKLGITVPYSNVAEIQLSCSADIAGTAEVGFDGGPDDVPEIRAISNGAKTITLSCADAGGFKKGSTYYACLFPTDGETDIKITFKTSNLSVYHSAKIDAMLRAKRCTANPTGEKGHCLVSLDRLGKSDNFPSTATSIYFDDLYYAPDYDPSGNIDDVIYFYHSGTVYSIVSGSEICLSGSLKNMFSGYESVERIACRILNTENVTDMSSMFEGCMALNDLDIGNFNTENVTDMSSMFNGCAALSSNEGDLPFLLNTEKVTDMSYMFNGCKSLDACSGAFSSFCTDNVTDMSYMFNGCEALGSYGGTNQLELRGFNTAKVTDMSNMFNGCAALEQLILSSFSTDKVTDMSYMFNGCAALKQLSLSFSTDKVTDMSYMFNGCAALEELDLSTFSTALVADMSYMFNGCKALKYIIIEDFNAAKVTDMSYMFNGCAALEELNLATFSTALVTDMSYMFNGCAALERLSLSKSFNTAKVTDMSSMFNGCETLSSTLYLIGFNTENVTDMSNMFYGCKALTEVFVTDKFIIPDGCDIADMFTGCSKSGIGEFTLL